jgi:D-psicose/D-tagatose/L-ribulose 3-epimerase
VTHRSPPIGIISMFYARPFTAAHLALLPRMRESGMDFVELLVPEPGELDLALARSALREHGLGVVLAARVNLSRDLASDDPAAVVAGRAYLGHCIDTAVALGASIVGGPLYGAPLVFAGRAPTPVVEVDRLRRVEQVISGLRAAGRRAADAGVRLAVEPLNRFETDFLSTVTQGLDLVRQVDSPAVGLLLDTFHMNMEEPSLPQAILEAAGHIVHFQANENHRGFVGQGHIDWPEVARALARVGYAGPITLEPFRRDEQRLGVGLAQWRAPTSDEDTELAASAAALRATLRFAGVAGDDR